jgi:hypothetical protein
MRTNPGLSEMLLELKVPQVAQVALVRWALRALLVPVP